MAINLDKCIGCGSCVKECTRNLLAIQNGKAVVTGSFCMLCGHCVAACPVDAIRISGMDASEAVEYDPGTFIVAPENLLNTMKFRRSIRFFRDEPVSDADLNLLIEAGRYAPTGANRQKKRYIVLRNRLDEITELSLKTLHDAALNMENDPALKGVLRYKEKWMTLYRQYQAAQKDGLFYHAPIVILVIDSEPSHSNSTLLNAGLAAANIELMAHVIGLGACYIGFFAWAVKLNPQLAELVSLQPGEELVAALAVGKPDTCFYRTVSRSKPNVTII